MKFLVPNYSCLQNPWLGGYCPPDPRSLCLLSSTAFVEPPLPRTKFLGTPLRNVILQPTLIAYCAWNNASVQTRVVSKDICCSSLNRVVWGRGRELSGQTVHDLWGQSLLAWRLITYGMHGIAFYTSKWPACAFNTRSVWRQTRHRCTEQTSFVICIKSDLFLTCYTVINFWPSKWTFK